MSPGRHSLLKQMAGSTPAPQDGSRRHRRRRSRTRAAGLSRRLLPGRILHASMIEFRALRNTQIWSAGSAQFHKFNVGCVAEVCCKKLFVSDFSIALQQIEFTPEQQQQDCASNALKITVRSHSLRPEENKASKKIKPGAGTKPWWPRICLPAACCFDCLLRFLCLIEQNVAQAKFNLRLN